jgi:hypothetical protein
MHNAQFTIIEKFSAERQLLLCIVHFAFDNHVKTKK